MKGKRKYRTPSKQEKLRYLRALEGNDMNKSLTARQLNISRSTLTKYYKLHWDQYLKQKSEVKNDSLNIESKKILLSADLENVRIVLAGSCQDALELMNDKIKNSPENISTKDLVAYITALLPYIAEKRVIAGAKDTTNNSSMPHTTFVQMINQRIKKINLEKMNTQEETT